MIIDSHVHLWMREHLPDKIVGMYLEPLRVLEDLIDLKLDQENVWPDYGVNVNKLLDMMAAGPVDKAVVLPIDYGLLEASKIGIEDYNKWVFETTQPYSDKIIPLMGIDPRRDFAIEFAEEMVKRYNAIGVKLYPATGWYPYDERFKPFWRKLEDLGMMIISHSGASWGPLMEEYNDPSFWRPVLEEHEDMNIVVAHLGGKWRADTYRLCNEYPNLYTDLSALQGWLPTNPEVALSRLKEVAEHVPSKASFGTDWPLFDLQYASANWLRFVKEEPWAGEEIKEKVLGGNIQKALGL